jgi:hypothetical protein
VGAETGNASTPAHKVTDTSKSLNTNAEMSVTPPATVPAAVTGRSYGTAASGCSGGACTGIAYSLSNGLGNYTSTGSSLKTTSDTFSCSFASPAYTCTDATIAGTANATLTFTGAETGNIATPGNTVTDTSKTLITHAEMTVTPPASVPIAVHGRRYGTGSGCSGGTCVPLQYSVSNGLGTYTMTGTSLTSTAGTFTCSLSSPTFSCSSTGISGAGGTTPALTFVGAETGNAATPGKSVTDTSQSLTINAALSVTPPGSAPDAVTGRAYGHGSGCSGGTCQPLQYTLANGTGSYNAAETILTLGGGEGFPCQGASSTISCFSTGIASAGGTVAPLDFVGLDNGNASAPGGSVTDSSLILTVDYALALGVAIGGVPYSASSPWPVGVVGRPYGSGLSGCTAGSCKAPTYTVSGGLGSYTFSSYSALASMGFSCTPSSPTLTCSASSLSSGTPSVTVGDANNASTPTGSATLTSSLTVNPELAISNTYLENATVGEPYSAILDSNRAGVGSPYVWCMGTVASGPTCTPSGGMAGVSFGTPSPVPSDDTLADIRGYYFGTPTTTGAVSTSIQVADEGNVTTPGCFTTTTCPTLALTTAATEPKVFAANGFAATYGTGSPTDQGDTLFAFTATAAPTQAFNLTLDSSGYPVTPRVTPDGNWVYVTETGANKLAVVSPSTGAKAVSATVSNTGTFNPAGLDIEPQQFFAANPNTTCSTNCSNLGSYIRYDAYLTDPTRGTQTSATVEPVPDAENPGLLPTTLSSSNALTLADANNLAISLDGSQAFVSLSYEPTGTACGTPPCTTLGVLGLTAPSVSNANTTAGYYSAFTGQTAATFSTFGLYGGAVAVNPNGQYVATATRSDDNTVSYLTMTTTGASPAFAAYLPTTSGVATHPTTNVCSSGSSGTNYSPVAALPVAIAASPDGNRLFVACQSSSQSNNTVGVWDISGTSSGIPFVQSIPLTFPSYADTNSENGCATPVDIKAMLTGSATYGTRLFVSCQGSDTIVPIDYNSGAGSTTVDNYSVGTVVSTDATPITNATLGNTTGYNTYPCGNGGSCPLYLDLMPNPAIHFTTGGAAPTLPFALPAATSGSSYSYYVVAQGGAVPRTFSETTATPVMGTGACTGLSLATNGLVSGTPTTAGTCGPFTVRVKDGSTPAQFVERTFTIKVN